MTDPSRPPALSPGQLAGWAWRQLTSMRVALLLLFLLALAAIPGSVVPQREDNPLSYRDFRERNPELSEWYDRLGLFDVFSTPWFAAIYLALLVSLVGCIVPRSFDHWRALRTRPPRTPSRLARLPSYQRLEVDASPAAARDAARAELRARRYRLGPDEPDAVGGEAGRLREAGNLVFHLALVGLLLSVALGGLFGYRGSVIVPEGSGFSNLLIQYDGISGGALFDPAEDLPPFTLHVDEFVMEFHEGGPQLGAAEDFEARVRFRPEPGAPEVERAIRVNEPLEVDGTLVHILNPGYAPVLTVRDAEGNVLDEGPAPFLPQDNNFTSTGVRKISRPSDQGADIGLDAIFLPTAVATPQGFQSVFPGANNPMLYLTAHHGDLGLNSGQPQSVYQLDTSQMEPYRTENGQPFWAVLAEGETIELPGGEVSVTFEGYVTWVNIQISRNAGKELTLGFAVLAVAGLLGSLYVHRRRAWVRVPETDGSTVVEVAGLARSEGGDLDSEVARIADGVRRRLGEPDTEEHEETDGR